MGHPQHSLIYLLQKAAKYSLAALEAELADLNLTARQYLVLALVGTGEARSQHDLATRLGIDPTIVVKLIDQLEARGLLERERDSADRRRHQLALTTKGSALLRDADTRHQRAEREFTKRIGGDRADLRATLAKLLPPPS